MPLTQDSDMRWLPTVHLKAALSVPRFPGDVSWDDRIRSFYDDRRPPVHWHLISDGQTNGLAYLVGYDSQSKARIGFIGTKGFRPEALPPEEQFPLSPTGDAMRSRVTGLPGQSSPFPVGGGRRNRASALISPWCIYVHSDQQRIYRVDLSTRQTQVVLDDSGIRAAELMLQYGPGWMTGTSWFLVRTEHEVLVFNNENEIERRFRIPTELQDVDFSFGVTSEGHGLCCSHFVPDDHAPEYQYRIYWVDQSGRIVRNQDATIKGNNPGVNFGTLLGAIMPAPVLAGSFVAGVRPYHLMETYSTIEYAEGLRRSANEYWPALLLAGAIGAFLALACLRRQTRYATSGAERFVWPVFVFLFGVPGWVAYLTCRSWPVLDRCPACQVRVPRDRYKCAACQSGFPAPPMRGIEVYAA
jgi:hypothetical protein